MYVYFVYREHLCFYPIIDYLFYSILVGEQEGSVRTTWYEKMENNCIYNIVSFLKMCFSKSPIISILFVGGTET
jgi:hypothetical protein